jgi:NADH-quinone oxidoreductase subunit G
MADVNLTIDGKKVSAPAGTLLIEVCRSIGTEVPAFCYYPGLSLQAACRMCLVEIEKMPKMQTACTVPVTEGMVVRTDTDKVKLARKTTLEYLLGNHPLDCPVCDAGGECELQDMTFAYGAAESKFMEFKLHRDEQQWSPVVFFDRPRCILCYRCVRVCGEAMDVWALGVQNRASSSTIAPNKGDHLECEECGMCIDICPVGALTSGAYRYKTRPWEMNHVGTICTHCGDGCKTTLGVRRHESGMQIVRGDNRDKSGINGDFLCIKGRYAFDFAHSDERLTRPLVRRSGRLEPTTWEDALELVAKRLQHIRDTEGGPAIGVIGSTRTTNEENYLLQKFARAVLRTNNIDHHRTADYPALAAALKNTNVKTATMRDVFTAGSILLIGNNPTDQHPLLAYNIRNNTRLNKARLYCINSYPIKLRRQASWFVQVPAGAEARAVESLAGGQSAGLDGSAEDALRTLKERLQAEENVVIIFGSEIRGRDVASVVRLAASLKNAKIICLGDYANSHGAADMGLYPDLLPGYTPLGKDSRFAQEWDADLPTNPGMDVESMIGAARDGRVKVLYVVGSNPIVRYNVDPFALQNTFVVAHDMFMTETASLATVVFPAANAYEKVGTFTNTCGDLQLLKKAGELSATKPDFEIIVEIADRMGYDIRKLVPIGSGVRADMGQSRGAQSGEADRHAVWLDAHDLEPKISPFDPEALLDEIQRLVPGYEVPRLELMGGNDVHTSALELGTGLDQSRPELIVPSQDTLFTSGTLGRYSNTLQTVIENRRKVPADKEVAV